MSGRARQPIRSGWKPISAESPGVSEDSYHQHQTKHLDVDVAVLGGGFGGSLTALLLRKIGLTCCVIERFHHPRFSLGESSTPQADLILDRLATVYDLPRIKPLATWGEWQRTYPDLPCGLKRGFSYFHHHAGEPFIPYPDHRSELLVASSVGDEDADTHWHRATFDQFVFEEARAAGVPCFEGAHVCELIRDAGWSLTLERTRLATTTSREGFLAHIRTRFLIDASGDGQFLTRRLNLPSLVSELDTRSRCVFGHFRGLRRWADLCGPGTLCDDPFPRDDAALHHVFPGGWMYVLPFNTGVTSAGFCLDIDRFPVDEGVSPLGEWRSLLARFPSIGEQFANTEVVDPPGGVRRSPRLQRFVIPAAGPDWALLPTTAYILDALYSTGNAHTLSGIERLIEILEAHWQRPSLADALATYSRQVEIEVRLLDEIVAGSYAAFEDFNLFSAYSMFYFAGATYAEHRRRRDEPGSRAGFLCSDLPDFRAAVSQGFAGVRQAVSDPGRRTLYHQEVARLLAPFNVAGLCDAARRNMYPFAP